MLGVDINGGLLRIIARRWNFGWLIGNQRLICTVDSGCEPTIQPLKCGRYLGSEIAGATFIHWVLGTYQLQWW